MPPKQLADIVEARGFGTNAVFAEALGYSVTLADCFRRGWFAPNHPLVPKVAEVLGLNEHELRTFARKPPMTEGGLAICQARMGKPSPRRGVKQSERKPNQLVTVKSRERLLPARRNALLRMDKTARQTARSLAMQASLLAMQGKKYMDVAVPVEGMAMILNDWFRLKGIPKQVVVDVDYEEIFG